MTTLLNSPQRGQPMSYNDLSQMVTAITELQTTVSSKSSESTFNNGDVSLTQKTSQMQFVALYQDNAYVGDADPAHPKTVTVSFNGVSFNGAPIVTVTPKAINAKNGSITTSAVVKDTTASSVTIVINFNTKQSGVAVGLNIIAVGIPNTRV
jgi:hypothetical protein